MEFPDDDNGDVLKGMHDSGMNLAIPHRIDFFCLFPMLDSAKQAYEFLKNWQQPDHIELLENTEVGGWDIVYSMDLIPEYKKITEMENILGKIAEKFGGKIDGWGVLQE